MKETAMSASRIVRIPILPFGMVNCHLIAGPGGCVLVDTGLPGSEGKIARALNRLGLAFSDIRLIVITHAHVDHAGSAAAVRALSGAPIVAHAGDLCHYTQEKAMTFCPTGWFGRLFLKTGLIRQPYAPFIPDLLLTADETLDLAPYGVAGAVRRTAGHTYGSISVELAGGQAMVGDLIASGVLLGGICRTGHAIRPPFEADALATARALQQLLDNGAATFHMGHGGPLGAPEVQAHAGRLLALGCVSPSPSEPEAATRG
jgi:hydroxyacylglutathione hydrolase